MTSLVPRQISFSGRCGCSFFVDVVEVEVEVDIDTSIFTNGTKTNIYRERIGIKKWKRISLQIYSFFLRNQLLWWLSNCYSYITELEISTIMANL